MTNSDWIQVWIAVTLSATLVVLTITLIGVFWYAWQTRRQADATIRIGQETNEQARATQRLARAALQPVLVQWLDVKRQMPCYWNIGTGPALNIRWSLGDQSDRRPAMGIRDDKGDLAAFDLTKLTSPALLVAEYNDVEGTRWRSTSPLVKRDDGRWDNGWDNGEEPTYGLA